MPTHGKRDQYSDAPKFQVNDNGKTGQEEYGNTVFAVDANEVAATPGIAHQGWVKRTVGSGGRAGRVQIEVLATAKIQGDATDFANTDSQASSTGTADDAIFPDA